MNVKRVIVFLQLLETIYGVIDLTCDTANPSTQTNVTCVCTRKNGSSIKWYFDGISVADCFLTKGCFPKPDSYTFSINVSEFAYEMTKSGYDYNDCTPIQCTDAGDTSIEKTVVPAPVNFDPSNSTTITEPISNHTDGTVSITTGCISGYIDVKCEWYIVYDEKEEIYKHGQSAFDTYDNSTCSNCINDVLAKKTCGFIHEEASGNETKIVYFKVVLTHTPTNFKWKVKSANVYTVKDSYTTSITNPAANATDSQRGTTTSALKNSSTPNHPIMTSSPTMQHTLIATTVKYKTELLIDRDMALYIGFSSMIFIFIVVIAYYSFSLLKQVLKGKSNIVLQRERDQNSANLNVLNSTQL